jgi:hypothetical protein
MATNVIPPPPPGFVLDDANKPPEGFVLDDQPKAPPPPVQAQESIPSRLISGAGRNIADLAKGAYGIASTGGKIISGNPQGVQELGDMAKGARSYVQGAGNELRKAVGIQPNPYMNQEQTAQAEAAFSPTKKAIQHPLDYMTDNPVNAGLAFIPAFQGARNAAGLSKIPQYAKVAESQGISQAIDKAIDAGISKGIRPSVEGQRTFGKMNKYNERARVAVKAITANKANLALADDAGQVTAKLPGTVKELSQAIDQTKKQTFAKYDAMASQAGGQGAAVDLADIVSELGKVADNKVLNDLRPEIANYVRTRQKAFSDRGRYTTTEAQDAIATMNDALEAYYKNPSYENATKASVDSLIANRLRKGLDSTIEGIKGEGYQDLKNTYGALSTIERDVVRRSIVDARKNVKGLIDFSDIFSGSQVVSGLLSFNPATIASGVTAKAIASVYKHLNSPNRAIKNMFTAVDKFSGKIEKPGTVKLEGGWAPKYEAPEGVPVGKPYEGHVPAQRPPAVVGSQALVPTGITRQQFPRPDATPLPSMSERLLRHPMGSRSLTPTGQRSSYPVVDAYPVGPGGGVRGMPQMSAEEMIQALQDLYNQGGR